MKTIKKIYTRVIFRLVSPLSISNGKDAVTDRDLLLDSKGMPYIPGSAVAGVTREAAKLTEKEICRYFGDIGNGSEADITESRLVFFDAVLYAAQKEVPEKKQSKAGHKGMMAISYKEASQQKTVKELQDEIQPIVSVRDSVALDEFKNSVPGAKFDMEVLEPGVMFSTFIEQNICDGDKDITKEILQAWIDDEIRFGGKTTRGYGEIKVEKVQTKEFDFNNPKDIKTWLKFRPESAVSGWSVLELEKSDSSENISIDLSLKLKSCISVRKYSAKPSTEEKAEPDFVQLTVGDKPVIPGTTWSGAFRHHIRKLAPLKEEFEWVKPVVRKDGSIEEVIVHDNYFGKVVPDGEKTKSHIMFNESTIDESTPKTMTRNAINRFTGGSAATALFTAKVYYGGVLPLRITFRRLPGDQKYSRDFVNAFFAAIADLHEGFLSIGGETSVGRGLFEVIKVADQDFHGTGADLYALLNDQFGKELTL